MSLLDLKLFSQNKAITMLAFEKVIIYLSQTKPATCSNVGALFSPEFFFFVMKIKIL